MKTPTLREIAAACGVNVSTVSRALAGHRKIPAATRAMIQAQAGELGWRPNALASAYMAHLRSTREPAHQANLAFVIALPGVRRFEDLPAYHRLVFSGATRHAAAHGYSLEPVWLAETGFDLARLSRVLWKRGVVGVILHGGNLPKGAFDRFDWESFAVATWGYSIQSPELHRAGYHMAQGMRLALRKLRDMGYRRVALVQSRQQDELSDHAMLMTFFYEQRKNRGAGLMKIHEESGAGDAILREIGKWIEKKKPDAIIGDQPAWGAIQRLGWRVPADVAFVSPYWDASWAEIGGIDHCPELIGENVMELIVGQILRNERGIPASPKLLLNEGVWRDGQSIPDLAGPIKAPPVRLRRASGMR